MTALKEVGDGYLYHAKSDWLMKGNGRIVPGIHKRFQKGNNAIFADFEEVRITRTRFEKLHDDRRTDADMGVNGSE